MTVAGGDSENVAANRWPRSSCAREPFSRPRADKIRDRRCHKYRKPAGMNPHELPRRIAAGERDALGEAYELYQRKGLLFARTLTSGNSGDAEDLLEECFVRLWERRAQLSKVENLAAYLFTMLRHVFLNRARAAARERQRLVAWAESSGLIVEGPADAEFSHGQVSAALAALPDEQRQVVVLKIWGELTFAEVAAVLELSQNTAASRYRRGLERLRRLLGGSDER